MPENKVLDVNKVKNKLSFLSLSNKSFSYWFSFVWFKAILMLLSIIVFFVFLDFAGFFIITKTPWIKTLNQLGFFRYFTNVKYTNFVYKPIAIALNQGNVEKVRDMIRPRSNYPYLIRGKNYNGEYTYGFVGRYERGFEFDSKKENDLGTHYAVIELKSDKGNICSFRYKVNSGLTISYVGNPVTNLANSPLYMMYSLGLPLKQEETNKLFQEMICDKEGLNCEPLIKNMKVFVSPNFPFQNGISVFERYFKKGDLIMVKFLSSAPWNELKFDCDGQYDLISALSF